MSVNQVNLIELFQRRSHGVVPFCLLPIAVYRLQQRFDSGFLANKLIEPVMPIVGRLSPHPSPELNQVTFGGAGAAQKLNRVLPSSLADDHVITTNEAGILIGVNIAVQNNNRNFLVDCFKNDSGETG